MDRARVLELFNREPRLGALATADRNGRVNNAVFSAMRMTDEETVMLAIGDNRSYANLQENPQAAYVFFEPAGNPFAWQGARIYLKVADIAESGPQFTQMVDMVRQAVGDQAANHVKAVITFKIDNVRPLIDFGK